MAKHDNFFFFFFFFFFFKKKKKKKKNTQKHDPALQSHHIWTRHALVQPVPSDRSVSSWL